MGFEIVSSEGGKNKKKTKKVIPRAKRNIP
jgi:hypothetical protein